MYKKYIMYVVYGYIIYTYKYELLKYRTYNIYIMNIEPVEQIPFIGTYHHCFADIARLDYPSGNSPIRRFCNGTEPSKGQL